LAQLLSRKFPHAIDGRGIDERKKPFVAGTDAFVAAILRAHIDRRRARQSSIGRAASRASTAAPRSSAASATCPSSARSTSRARIGVGPTDASTTRTRVMRRASPSSSTLAPQPTTVTSIAARRVILM